MRCDLCCTTKELNWTYVTRPTAEVSFEDPEWLVCSTCDAIIQDSAMSLDERLETLIARAIVNEPVVISSDQEFVEALHRDFPAQVRRIHTHFMHTWDARHPEPGYRMETP